MLQNKKKAALISQEKSAAFFLGQDV